MRGETVLFAFVLFATTCSVVLGEGKSSNNNFI